MLRHIKRAARQIIELSFIKNTLIYLLSKCLPNAVLLSLKRKLGHFIYKDNLSHAGFRLKNGKSEPFLRWVPSSNLKKEADLVICCAFQGRHEIVEKSITESLFKKRDYHVEWFLCGSTEADYQFIQTMAAKTGRVSGMTWRNNPLGEKWQSCVQAAGDVYDAKLYAITGSDDILSSTLIGHIIEKHEQNLRVNPLDLPAMYYTDQWVVIRTASEGFPSVLTCTLLHKAYYVPIGAGRFYTKEFLQAIEFKLFDTTRDRCLDDFSYFSLIKLGYRIESYSLDEGLLISVKGNWQQMNLVEAILKSDSIEIKDCTFTMQEQLRHALSPEIYSYLIKNKTSDELFAWSV